MFNITILLNLKSTTKPKPRKVNLYRRAYCKSFHSLIASFMTDLTNKKAEQLIRRGLCLNQL